LTGINLKLWDENCILMRTCQLDADIPDGPENIRKSPHNAGHTVPEFPPSRSQADKPATLLSMLLPR